MIAFDLIGIGSMDYIDTLLIMEDDLDDTENVDIYMIFLCWCNVLR
jgi:hypothetical protein